MFGGRELRLTWNYPAFIEEFEKMTRCLGTFEAKFMDTVPESENRLELGDSRELR